MTRFLTTLDPAELPALFRRTANIVGWKTWQNRIDRLRSELASNPHLQSFFYERHGLELAFGDIHRHLQLTGRCPWPPQTAEQYRLYSFLAVAVQVYEQLSVQGRARLAGAIRSGLEKEFGLGPVAFEMKIVAHLMSQGFNVEFHDLELGGGYDFLAVSGRTEIEVECKHLSADIGRQIHRRKLCNIGGALHSVIKNAVEQGNDGHFLQVTLPGRLTSRQEQQRALKVRIESVLSGVVEKVDDHLCTISAQPFSVAQSPFSSERGRDVKTQDIEEFFGKTFRIGDAHLLFHWRPGHGAVVIHFKSMKPDKVLASVFKRLKVDAKKQFTSNRPALLCVHLADLTHEQLLDLANREHAGIETGIQSVVSMILQTRPHLHSITVMADGEVRMKRERADTRMETSVQEIGPTYTFRNTRHSLTKDQILDRIFV